jgi:hypothetical protein
MIVMFIFILIISYVSCIVYVKYKMKEESESILEKIKNEVDRRNLDNLIKLSEKAQNPDGYNSNIIQYQEEIALYTGSRALASPKETFADFLSLLIKLLTF